MCSPLMNRAESPGCRPRVPLKNCGEKNVNVTKHPAHIKLRNSPIQLQLSGSPHCIAGNVKPGHCVVNYLVKLEATVDTKL